MNSRKVVIVVFMISAIINNVCKAQQSTSSHIKYSVIMPNNYQSQGKSYPLIVCYKSQDTDSLLQKYATNKQSIVLQFESVNDTNLEADSLKAVIQKLIHEFSVAKDKIYLLGINENIYKTAELRDILNYYFAATAYITNSTQIYTLLKDGLKLNNSVKIYLFNVIDDSGLETANQLFLQNYSWTVALNKISEDAVKLNFENSDDKHQKYQLSFGYGTFNFFNFVKSGQGTLLEIPKTLNASEVSIAKYFSKSLSAKISLGILVKKIAPPRPDIFSVINGADIDVKGGGILLMPISIGMDYYFLKNRFRPYSGFSIGMVPAKYKYVEATGNLSNGINRNESEFNSNTSFVELSSGFTYRFGKNVQLGLSCDYVRSKEFDINFGAYNTLGGLKIATLFAIMF